MVKDACTRMNFFARLAKFKEEESVCCSPAMPSEERRTRYTSMADEAFDEEEGK